MPEVATVKTASTGCTGGKPTPSKVLATGTLKPSTGNSCSGLQNPQTITLKVVNTPAVSPVSVLKGKTSATLGTPISFNVAGAVTGSYPSKTAKATGKLKETLSQLATECGSTGISILHIVSGTASNF